ncbi:MAG: hypothetical protein DWQ19_09900 [Crenarchaeota archaeon]|nr:MAG: hypothetical protein DWQ19_09900 [Thermoproteota archaeon]
MGKIEDLLNNLPKEIVEFKPYAYVSKRSDSLTAYFKNEADYSVVVNENITLYRSLDTDEVVGIRIDGLSKLELDT